MVLYQNLILFIILIIKAVKSDNLTSKCVYKKTNTTGICITIQNCKAAQEEITTSGTIQSCGFDNGIPKVCCPKLFGNEITSIAEEKCKTYSKIYEKIPEKIETLTFRISGGTDAKFGEYPHMAILGYGNRSSVSWDCGGILISEKFVLTAAHCISGKNVTLVQLGDIEIDSSSSKTYSVLRTHKYPDYNIATQYHDIGLVELTETVEFSANIIPACLPKSTHIFRHLIVSGFGALNLYGTRSQTLQWTNVNYFSINECFTRFNKTRQLPNGVLDEIQLCYGSRTSGRDACQGDSGGPLQNYDYNLSLHRIIGIVSIGRLCGSPNTPGIYTKVMFYNRWIESIVWKNTNQDCIRISTAKEEEAVVPKRLADKKCNEYSKQIKNEEDATNREFPHMAALGFGEEQNPFWGCSGTLISENVVLTSRICINNPNYGETKFVQLGDNFLNDSSTTRKIMKISKIHRYPNYNPPAAYDDIALLELELSVNFSQYIKPACLQINTDNNSFLKFKTIVTGWGFTDKYNNLSKDLQKIEHQYFDDCQSYYSGVSRRRLPNGINSTSQFCFGTKVKDIDACRGFGGGPLQFYDCTTSLHRVIGIVSIGKLCGSGDPGIFTIVANYINWIEDIVWK